MDLKLIESNDGGDVVKNATDLEVIFGFQNMIYIALFGGNPEASTPITRLATEQDLSYWGNNLFHPQESGLQFNSSTEKTLLNVTLNSSGRTLIQQAVESDLAFMKEFATVKVVVSVIGLDSILIAIRVLQPDNLQEQDFVYIWNVTRQELLQAESVSITPNVIKVRYFDDSFDLSFETIFPILFGCRFLFDLLC
jgi:phage gp46-like protein